MFDETDIEFSLDVLAKVLRSAPEVPPSEEMLFSIGGRGYNENPATEILAFFMRPDGQHALGETFLYALFKRMGMVRDGLRFHGVSVKHQWRFAGGQIDLLIVGPGWFLIIENKIRAGLTNDFEAYEKAATDNFPGCKPFFVILAPKTVATKDRPQNWRSVTYKDYCAELKRALFDVPLSKWFVFAKEFVVHLEKELYETTMRLNEQHVAFVEENWSEIAAVTKMSDAYAPIFCERLRMDLREAVPEFEIEDQGWAIVCDVGAPQRWRITFQTPIHCDGKDISRRMFRGGVEVSEAPDRKRREARAIFTQLALKHFPFDPLAPEEGEWFEGEFEKIRDAVACFLTIATAVAKLTK